MRNRGYSQQSVLCLINEFFPFVSDSQIHFWRSQNWWAHFGVQWDFLWHNESTSISRINRSDLPKEALKRIRTQAREVFEWGTCWRKIAWDFKHDHRLIQVENRGQTLGPTSDSSNSRWNSLNKSSTASLISYFFDDWYNWTPQLPISTITCLYKMIEKCSPISHFKNLTSRIQWLISSFNRENKIWQKKGFRVKHPKSPFLNALQS